VRGQQEHVGGAEQVCHVVAVAQQPNREAFSVDSRLEAFP
jgi:hypothetical protein